MNAPRPLLLAFYADDFTGSTDALETLAAAGARVRLFLTPPAPRDCEGLDAVGVAGLTRSLAPAAIAAELGPAFRALRALGPAYVHYKVCSTFDSSPEVGSIGAAIDTGVAEFGGPFVPLLVAAPALGRHCVFGNLFARYGIGSAGEIHRLDRHPAMCRHPVTPAGDADLRRHLALQTARPIGLLDVLSVNQPLDVMRADLARVRASGAEIVLLDALHASDLTGLAALLEAEAPADRPFLVVGSSGVGVALGTHWARQGRWSPRPPWPDPGPVRPLLVVSGSCSPVTAGQIAWAEAHGFVVVPWDGRALEAAGQALAGGRSVVVCSSRGTAGPEPLPAAEVGTGLGRLAGRLIEAHGVRRIVVAGGDTSGHAARALGIEALEMVAPLTPGAPLCRVHAPGRGGHGLEVTFKGGQVGAPEFFGIAARGSP